MVWNHSRQYWILWKCLLRSLGQREIWILSMNNVLNSKDNLEEGKGKVVGSLGVGTRVVFEVSSNPSHSMIPWMVREEQPHDAEWSQDGADAWAGHFGVTLERVKFLLVLNYSAHNQEAGLNWLSGKWAFLYCVGASRTELKWRCWCCVVSTGEVLGQWCGFGGTTSARLPPAVPVAVKGSAGWPGCVFIPKDTLMSLKVPSV